jgi:hypothetical protein
LACATRNLLSWFRWGPFLVTFLAKQKSNKSKSGKHMNQEKFQWSKAPGRQAEHSVAKQSLGAEQPKFGILK